MSATTQAPRRGSNHHERIEFGDARLPERFWAKVEVRPDGCWAWTGRTPRHGYGHYGVKEGERWFTRRAHRVAWTELVGPIPEGLELDHLCRVKACVNPAHLEPVTHAENVRRGASVGWKATHCVHGHEFSGENLIVTSKGYRWCRECRRRWGREYRQRRREREAAA